LRLLVEGLFVVAREIWSCVVRRWGPVDLL